MVDIDERNLERLAPGVPARQRGLLAEGSQMKWRRIEGGPLTEEHVFDRAWKSMTGFYLSKVESDQVGEALLSIFERNRNIAEAFTKLVLRNEDVRGRPLDATLTGARAKGPSEAFMRPITRETFYDGDENEYAFKYEEDYDGETDSDAGDDIDIIPNYHYSDEVDDYFTARDRQQAFVIFGHMDVSDSPRMQWDAIQEEMNDSIGVRRPQYVKAEGDIVEAGNMRIFESMNGPFLVEPEKQIDINVRLAQDMDFADDDVFLEIMPLGLEIIRADADNAQGPLD